MKKILSVFAFVLVISSVIPISFALETVSLPAVMDARVELASTNKNFGDSVNLYVRSGAGSDMRSFLGFNLSALPSNIEIKSAWLMLFMKDAPGVSRTYEVQRANASWVEGNGGSDNNPAGEITWNNQPAVAGNVVTNTTGTTDNVWLSWNVTEDAKAMLNGTNYGWRIKDAQENSTTGREAIFHSRETTNVSLAPKLVIAYENLTAILPAIVDCRPNPLTVGSSIEWINCFIEINGTNVGSINITTVALSVINKSGSSFPDHSFSHLDDYDLDGQADMQIRFDRNEMDAKYFGGVIDEKMFVLNVSGGVGSKLFDGLSNFTVVKSPEKLFAKYIVNSTSTYKGAVNRIPHLDLSDFHLKRTGFDGYFFSLGDPKLIGAARAVVMGEMDVEKTVMKGEEEMTLMKKQPVVITAVMNDYDDCSASKGKIYCEGSGWMMIANRKTGDSMKHELKKMAVSVDGKKASMQGGDFWNDVFSLTDIPIKNKKIV